ncbi:uncharacterized protein LOC142354420 isoform X3 [Convolutriloba macropyga]|uniref:uncharacterized protein LOC142354420 isoform X3 n=1 Tax=Convolutriloba macropyga TaxID=536237 RepID=UPI003F520ACE
MENTDFADDNFIGNAPSYKPSNRRATDSEVTKGHHSNYHNQSAQHSQYKEQLQQLDSLVNDLEDLKGLELWQAEQIYMQQKLLQDRQNYLRELSTGSSQSNPNSIVIAPKLGQLQSEGSSNAQVRNSPLNLDVREGTQASGDISSAMFVAQPQMQSSYGGGSRPNPELRTLSTFTSHQNNTFTNPSGAEVSYNFNQTNTILAGSTGNASYNSNAKSNTPGGGGYSSRDAFGAIGPGFSSANVGDNHIYSTIDEDQKQAQLSRLRLEFEGSMDTKNPNAGSKSAGTKNYQPIFAFNEWKDMQPTNSPQSLPSVGESPQLPLPMSALGSDSVALRRLQETSQQNRVTSNNNMLLMELDSVRAMFSEKEKELSVAVAKVEQLTAQLESLKVATPSPPASSSTPPASATAGITGYNSNGAKGATGPQGDGNNLVFDRMNSQILVRNMMNNEQASKLENRKLYLGERVTELDSLHAKMKALNDRINLIKEQQNSQQVPGSQPQQQQQTFQNIASQLRPNGSPNTSDPSLNSSNTSSMRNQFAPVKRFDSRPNPSLIAQVQPMRNVPLPGTPSPNNSDRASSSPRDEKLSPSPRNFLKPQMQQPSSMHIMNNHRLSPSYSGSPNASTVSNSPSISPNSSAMKNLNKNNHPSSDRVDYSKAKTDSLSDYSMKLAKVRPVQQFDGESSDTSTLRNPRTPNASSTRENMYTTAVEMSTKYSPDANTPSPNYQILKTGFPLRQPDAIDSNRHDQNQGQMQFNRTATLQTSGGMQSANTIRGSNSDQSKSSSGYVTADDPLAPVKVPDGTGQDTNEGLGLVDNASQPVIHQYPILQQFVMKNAEGGGSLRGLGANASRPSAYERLFPIPSPGTAPNDDSGDVIDKPKLRERSKNVLEESRSRPEGGEDDELDISRSSSSIHIVDKTTGNKQKRRRSSLVQTGDGNGPLIPQHLIPEHLLSDYDEVSPQRSPSEATTPESPNAPSHKPLIGILKKPKTPIRPRSYSGGENKGAGASNRRVVFDRLALFLDAALEGDLALVEQLYGQLKNPSAGNDEGITALHNAICAGHSVIVDYLVQRGCDVNAADSDGWTPLHCAASCNNLVMVRYLVEHGACIFARTFSDGETPAQKCEEHEPNYAACSQYLYGVQEKLGIMQRGLVYALYDYSAEQADELSVGEGEAVVVLRRGDDHEGPEWWTCTHVNTSPGGTQREERQGYLPRNIMGLFPRSKPRRIFQNVKT